MTDLYANAIGSIRVGMVDYQSNDQHRLLAAIRNVHAGILLLCKEKLRRLSPPDSDEVLLKQKIGPQASANSILQFVGSGKKTVDQQQIKERFRGLGISLEWSRLDAISDIRNNAEHYFFSGERSQIKQAMANACVLTRQLIVDVLDDEPSSALGAETWEALLEIEEVFEAELAGCKASMARVDWILAATAMAAAEFQCPQCASKLLRQADSTNAIMEKVDLRCSSCGVHPELSEVIQEALGEVFAGDLHIAAMEGGTGPIDTCPECGFDSYVIEEGACACCQFSMPDDAKCPVCGNALSLEDYAQNTGLCSYHAWTASKD